MYNGKFSESGEQWLLQPLDFIFNGDACGQCVHYFQNHYPERRDGDFDRNNADGQRWMLQLSFWNNTGADR